MSSVWFNGEIIEGTLPLDPHDRGLLLGDGLFETIAVVNQKPLWLDEHLQRMSHGAEELGLGLDAENLFSALNTVLRGSEAQFEVLRITLSRGKTSRGLGSESAASSLLITLDEFDAGNLFQSCKLKVSTVRRNELAPSSRLKTLSYIDGIVAAREVAADADDALMLNTAGYVASTAIANIFLLHGKQLITPRLDQGIIAGITRHALLENARKFGFLPIEKIVQLEDLFSADAVILSNSLRFIRPVTALNDEQLGTRSLDSLRDGLSELTKQQCGIDVRDMA